MARATELPIYREAYELLLQVTKMTQNYPRSYRQGLAREICQTAHIEPAEKGVDFVGHVIRPYRRQWRPKTQRAALRKIAQTATPNLVQTCNSYLGLAKSTGNRSQTLTIARAALKSGLAVNSNLNRTFTYAY